ncbi:MAG: hypothetical protein U0V48_14260 [Anaerolineales bacterium]
MQRDSCVVIPRLRNLLAWAFVIADRHLHAKYEHKPLLAYRISGKPFDLGLIGFAVTVPVFFLALPSGVLIERWDKHARQ